MKKIPEHLQMAKTTVAQNVLWNDACRVIYEETTYMATHVYKAICAISSLLGCLF